MKSTFIIDFPPKYASFCPVLRTFLIFFKTYSFSETVAKVAKYGSSRPSVIVFCSQLVVSLGGETTEVFEPFNDRKGRGVQIIFINPKYYYPYIVHFCLNFDR